MLRGTLERAVLAVAWIVTVGLLALGSAGLGTALDHPPAGLGRAELTWAGDSAVAPELDAATTDLAALKAEVDELGLLGRAALASIAGQKFDTLNQVVNDGNLIVVGLRRSSAGLRSRLSNLPASGADVVLRLSPATLDRYRRLSDAADLTDGLADNWVRLTLGSVSAVELSTLLSTHDERVVAAIEASRARRFDEAIALIDEATDQVDEAYVLRNALANTVDVATLDEWLRRNREYDVAVKALFVASAASPDRVTPEIREAQAAEQEKRAQLPETTRGLVIIMGEIGRGGLNQAVIGIESVRGQLGAALINLGVPAPEPTPLPSRSPSAAPSAVPTSRPS
jgi:hypothetical protein